MVTYAGGKRAEDIEKAVDEYFLKSRLFAIARDDADTRQAYRRWVDIVDWLIDDARSAGDHGVARLTDLQNLTKAPDVLVVAKPEFREIEQDQESPPTDSTPAPACTNYDVEGNFDDPRTQLTRLICGNIVETGWTSWRFE